MVRPAELRLVRTTPSAMSRATSSDMGPAPRRSSIFGLPLIPLLSLGCVTLGYLLVPHYRTPTPRTASATTASVRPPWPLRCTRGRGITVGPLLYALSIAAIPWRVIRNIPLRELMARSAYSSMYPARTK